MKSVIIFVPRFYGGGIGDLIKSSLSFYTWAKREGCEFYFDFSEHPQLGKCFNTKYIPSSIATLPVQEVRIYDRVYTKPYPDELSSLWNAIRTNVAQYRIKSNIFGFEPAEELMKNVDEFRNNVLVPSQLVKKQYRNILKSLGIEEKKYISVHIRCGDKYMRDFDRSCPNDKRFDVNGNACREIVATIDKFISENKEKREEITKYPIVIHSDSDILRKMISTIGKYKMMNSDIQHTAQHTEGNNLEPYISTMADFMVLSHAAIIIQAPSYSGFSHVASIYGNTEMHSSAESDFFHIMKFTNKI
jgi:hypothetical protein